MTPGTEATAEETEEMTALSAFWANTSMGGMEKRGMGGISPGLYPGTAAPGAWEEGAWLGPADCAAPADWCDPPEHPAATRAAVAARTAAVIGFFLIMCGPPGLRAHRYRRGRAFDRNTAARAAGPGGDGALPAGAPVTGSIT